MSDFFYNAIKRDIAMIQNDTLSFAFEVQGLKGQVPDNIVFTCKETIEDDNPLFSVSRADFVREVSYDPITDIRVFRIRIPPKLTENIALGRYFYDIQLNVNNDIITLMIGRLTIAYQVTTGAPDPQYEDGDYILYPQDNIPITRTKVYHELPISNIAAHIKDINGSEDTYTTAQMSDALTGIKSDIEDIVDIINVIIDGTEEIPLDEIASVIADQLGLYYENGMEEYY